MTKYWEQKMPKILDKKATILVFGRQFCSNNPGAVIVLPLEKIIAINQSRKQKYPEARWVTHITSQQDHQNQQDRSETKNPGCLKGINTLLYVTPPPLLFLGNIILVDWYLTIWSIPDFKIDKFLLVDSLFRNDNVHFYISDNGMFVFNHGKN